jgi:hypothetical protein
MDRQIARKLNGDVKARPARYSTSETAALRLLRRLGRDGMPSSVEHTTSSWNCTIWRGPERSGKRLSRGSGETRALAIGRAVLNATFDPGEPIRAADAHPLLARGLGRPPAAQVPTCGTCGIDLHLRHRSGISRYCGVCSWNRMRERFQAPRVRPAD